MRRALIEQRRADRMMASVPDPEAGTLREWINVWSPVTLEVVRLSRLSRDVAAAVKRHDRAATLAALLALQAEPESEPTSLFDAPFDVELAPVVPLDTRLPVFASAP